LAAPERVIPVNSAIESVMLTGINARAQTAAQSTPGRVLSATSVGAPFVTKIKGDAILPNGWRLDDLGDCFLGGSGIGILSTERANVISDKISCLATNGELWEGSVKAYGVDLDGIQGISGKVVSKQGTILGMTFLAGVASGLGTAITPVQVPSIASLSSGQSPYVTPSAGQIGRTAVGTGVSNASSKLADFYLKYASEMFPIVEVVAATRVTWILQESVVLTRKSKAKK